MSQPATLNDLLNYKPETYLSEEDVELLRNTFGGNNQLVNVLRKLLLPSIGDSALPVEEMGTDIWLTMGAKGPQDWGAMDPVHAQALIIARQDAIKFIAGGLVKLKLLANQPADENALNRAARREKDSAK